MHHVTRFDPGDLAVPDSHAGRSEGYTKVRHIGRDVGAVHTDYSTCQLAPHGSVDVHVHSYEELVFVLEGELVLTVDGTSMTLAPNECAFVAVGATHAVANPAGSPCRWIELVTPQARDAEGPPDTFFTGGAAPTSAPRLDVRDPRTRIAARWSPEQSDLAHVARRSPVDAPTVSASMSSALLAYSGIAVKMLVDERHGAAMGQLFMVDYRDDTVLHPHDHPLEEAFYMLDGEVTYIADGVEHVLRPGDVAFAAVGCVHAFENRSGRPCRWLETRAPHPPLQHAYRYDRDWDPLVERLGAAAGAPGTAA